jgi:hypothetical protein
VHQTKLQFPYDQYHTKKHLQKGIPGKKPHINLLTLEVKDVSYLKESGFVHHLKTTVPQQCESRWYSRIDMYESFYANYEGTENIIIERREEDRMVHVQCETVQLLLSFLTPIKEASLQLEAHATLRLFCQ